MSFYDDMEKALLEATEIEKGETVLTKRENMSATTYIVSEKEYDLIDEFIKIRKKEKISQAKLSELTGNKQQVISRLERKQNSPSLKLFVTLVDALGYELKIIKKETSKSQQ